MVKDVSVTQIREEKQRKDNEFVLSKLDALTMEGKIIYLNTNTSRDLGKIVYPLR